MALTETDRNLISRCVTNQPGAWRDFVDRFLGLFMHVVHHTAHARSVPITPELEDDLCAEVFVRLIEKDYAILRRFRGRSSLATYLTVVSRRIIVNEMAQRRMAEAMGHVHGHGVEPAAHESFERRIENRDEVEKLLAGLPNRDAEIVRRYHLQGQSYREISRDLGVPENTIGPALSRARKLLRGRRDGAKRRTSARKVGRTRKSQAKPPESTDDQRDGNTQTIANSQPATRASGQVRKGGKPREGGKSAVHS